MVQNGPFLNATKLLWLHVHYICN